MRLIESEGRLIDSPAVLTTDRELVVRSWAGWLTEIFPAEWAIGRPLTEVVPDLEERGLAEQLRDAVAHGRPLILAAAFHGHLVPCAPRVPTSGQALMRQHVVVSPIRAGDEVVGLTIVLRDATQRLAASHRVAEALASDDAGEREWARAAAASQDIDPTAVVPAMSDARWRVRRRASEAMAVAGAEATDALVALVRDAHADLSTLNAAVDALALKGGEVVSGLVELLDDKSPDVRIYAGLALGRAGHPDSVPALMQALGDPDVNVRFHTIEALGRLRALEAGAALMAIAEGDDDFTAFAALDAIAELGDDSLAPRVATLLERESVASAAVNALGGVGGPDQVHALTRMLSGELLSPDEPARALARIARRAATGRVPALVRDVCGPPQVGGLERALANATGEAAEALVEVTGWVPGERADRALTAALSRPELEAVAARALLARGDAALPALVSALAHEDPPTRARAATLLGHLGRAEAVPMLIELLDPMEPAAINAAGALGEIGDPRAFEPLLRLLDADSAALRRAAVGALNSMGHPELAAIATGLLKHASPRVRESAAQIVGYFGHVDAMVPFLTLLDDAVEGVRVAAAEHLHAFDGPDARAAIRRALADPSAKVRAACCVAIGHLADESAVSWLLTALDDPDMWVRYAAAGAARWHASPALEERLARAARSEAPPVQAAALAALGTHRSARIPAITSALIDVSEVDVVVAALEALAVSERPYDSEIVERALAHPDRRVRQAAAVLSVGKRDLEARALSDTDPAVLRAALDALVATREGVRTVIELSEDEARGALAREALAHARGDGVSELAANLRHPSPFVRLSLVRSLRETKGDGVVEALADALDDPVPAVQSAARAALEAYDLGGLDRTWPFGDGGSR